MESFAKFLLGLAQDSATLGAQFGTSAVDIEGQHRHRRPERFRLAPSTTLGGAFERARDLSGTGPREHARIEIEHVALLSDATRPTPRAFASGGMLSPAFRRPHGRLLN